MPASADETESYGRASKAKADFNAIYVSPDPRAYCSLLAPLGYQIPQHGADIFGRLLPTAATTGGVPTVLDLCSSYGFIGALMRTDLSNADVFGHYADPSLAELTADELCAADRAWLGEHRRPQAPRVVALDASETAVGYADRSGLVDQAYAENLEQDPASEDLAALWPDVDLVTTTGGVGYITDRTFATLLSLQRPGPPPWVASLVLRMYSYDEIAVTLAEHGLVTHKLTGRTFVQRRFVDDTEQEHVCEQLSEAGLDSTGLESDGCYHAELYVSRPESAPALPWSALVD